MLTREQVYETMLELLKHSGPEEAPLGEGLWKCPECGEDSPCLPARALAIIDGNAPVKR